MKGLLKNDVRLLILEPMMYVSRKTFESILRNGKEAGLELPDFPEKKVD